MTKRGPKSAADLATRPPAPPEKAYVVTKHPEPPAHLRPETAKWFKEIVRAFQLESHHVRVLTVACDSWDRQEEARLALVEHGLTFTNRDGEPRVRPEVAIERDSKIRFMRAVRELDLDISSPAEWRRPPSIPSNRG